MSLSDQSSQANPIDFWKGCHRGIYAYDFRILLTALAKGLRSSNDAAVHCRFNKETDAVEFVTLSEEVIATVIVSGSDGEAWAAEVNLKDMSQRGAFEIALVPLKIEFKELS